MDPRSFVIISNESGTKQSLSITYKYSVHWKESDVPVQERFVVCLIDIFFILKYRSKLITDVRGEFFDNINTVRWLAVGNAALIVVALVGVVAVIVNRILHNDLTRYEVSMQMEEGILWCFFSFSFFLLIFTKLIVIFKVIPMNMDGN